MSSSKFMVSHGVLSERVGDALMVVVPGRAEVVELTGQAVEVFRDVEAGKAVRPSLQALSYLEGLGIIESSGVSRRGLIKAGAVAASAGIAVMALPGVAAASSGFSDTPDMDVYGGSSGDPIGGSPTRRGIILGGWHLEELIPQGQAGVFQLLDQNFSVTARSGEPFFDINFTRDILEPDLAGQTATITYASLGLQFTYTFPV